jgi:hypothetical protein
MKILLGEYESFSTITHSKGCTSEIGVRIWSFDGFVQEKGPCTAFDP